MIIGPYIPLHLHLPVQPLNDDTAQPDADTPDDAATQHQDAFLRATRQETDIETDDRSMDQDTPRDDSDTRDYDPDTRRDSSIPAQDLPRGLPVVALPSHAGTTMPVLDHTTRAILLESLDRLLVSSNGREEVRMDLNNDTLPSVSIQLFDTDAHLTVCFTCAIDTTRRQLTSHSDHLAQELANRLQRDTLLQVQTDDPQDLRLHEILASPQPG